MKKFEDLLSKRDDEIEAAEKARREDERNYNASVGYGILGALGGLVGGFVFYIVVGLLAVIVTWSSKPFSETTAIIILILSLLIGGIIGFLMVFNDSRKK